MCLDFNSDGSLFATGGNDKVVKLYDDNMKTLICTMKSNSFSNPGHSNRIFSVLFSKESENTLVSGGWDNTLQIYDVREGCIVANIYGPHICGDSIDIKGNKILTASWSAENQIQVFDIRMLKAETILDWASVEGNTKKSSFLYTCQFARFRNEKSEFAVGGSSENLVAVCDFEKIKIGKGSDNMDFGSDKFEANIVMRSHNMPKSVYVIDYAYKAREFAIGCGNGSIHVIRYKEK